MALRGLIMPSLPKSFYSYWREVLLECDEFESDASLRDLFSITPELAPYQPHLPSAATKSERVDRYLSSCKKITITKLKK